MIYDYILRDNAPHRHILEVRDGSDDGGEQLRNRSYAMPCARPKDFDKWPSCLDPPWWWRRNIGLAAATTGRERLAILKVCQQVYLESIAMLYN